MLGQDNYTLSLYYFCSSYSSSSVINSTARKSDDSSKRWLLNLVCVCVYGIWACAYTFKWSVCPPSAHTPSITDKYCSVKGSEQWICCLTITQCVLRCHSTNEEVFFSLCVCRNIISVFVWEDHRQSSSNGGSAVSFYSFHRGDKGSGCWGHDLRVQTCHCSVWHCEWSISKPAVWTVTAGMWGGSGSLCRPDMGIIWSAGQNWSVDHLDPSPDILKEK